MSALKLVQVWDIYDKSLYLKAQNRITHEGKSTFWRAVDKTVRFCDTNILKKSGSVLGNQQQHGFKKKNQMQMSWKNLKKTVWTKNKRPASASAPFQHEEQPRRYQLPAPPGLQESSDSD